MESMDPIPNFKDMMKNLEANLRLPRIEMPRLPEIKVKDMSMAEMKAKSADELLAFLLGEDGTKGMIPLPLQQAIRAELALRSAAPHWSQTPAFWVGVVGTVVGIGAFIMACLAYWKPQPVPQVPALPVPTPTTQVEPAKPPSGPQTIRPKAQSSNKQ